MERYEETSPGTAEIPSEDGASGQDGVIEAPEDLSDAVAKLPRNAVYKELFDCIDEIADYGVEETLTVELTAQIASSSAGELTTVDIQCWCPEENADARRRNTLVQAAIAAAGGMTRDSTVRPTVGLSLIRATVPTRSLAALASLDHVRKIDGLPHPDLTHLAVARATSADLPLILPPRDDAPLVALIDSGIREGHPLLAPAVVAASASSGLRDATDEHGHGTFVASLILYGSLEDQLAERSLQPQARLISIRVLDDTNQFPEDALWETELLDALEVAHEQGARVVNVSIGDSRRPYLGPRPTPLAAAVDDFILRTGVVVILSAGNMTPNQYRPDSDPSQYIDSLLASPASGLLDPATSALAITVGALGADRGQGFHAPRTTVDVVPVGKEDWPSPATRVGPGASEMIKPELVAPGGGFAFDTSTKRYVSDPTLQVVGANALPAETVLAGGYGTSYATPLVTHAAALALSSNPGLTGNGIRALLMASARPTSPVHENPKPATARWAQHRLTGYGRPEGKRAALSTDHRAVLISEDAIPVNGVHLYSIQLPSSFFDRGGWRDLTVALAFDPQTRSTRRDYLSNRLAVTVYRGIDLGSVADAYIRFDVEEDSTEPASDSDENQDDPVPPALADYRVSLSPATNWRSRGANQVGRKRFHHVLDDSGGLDLILAVKSTNAWAPEGALQNYALAVVLERDENHAAVYHQLRLSVEQAIELEAELET